jgi:peptidoglycan/xylan/chitin deacetylase (PgdA/CDA1 family)
MVGNHTTDHVQLPALDDAGVRAQLGVTETAIVDVLGARPWLLRPPGGARSPRVDRLVASLGYTQMLWNLGAGDFQVATAEEVFDVWMRVLERRERDFGDRGGIVLLHDIFEHGVEAFPLIVEELRRRNCELLLAGEELYDIVDDPRFFFEARGESGPESGAAPASPTSDELAARQARIREETAQRCR